MTRDEKLTKAKALEAEAKKIREELEIEHRNYKRPKFPATYTFNRLDGPFFTVTRTPAEAEIAAFEEELRLFGSAWGGKPQVLHSVKYAVLDDLLIHVGGGNIILGRRGSPFDPPKLTPEEIAAIARGEVPMSLVTWGEGA